MHANPLIFILFLIFTGTALSSTAALYTRQSLLVAYMLAGVLLGPWGLKLVANNQIIAQTGDMGIIFLLFLLGLHLHPQNLLKLIQKISLAGIVSSVVFALIGFVVGRVFGYTYIESMVIGATMMFSSTIIGLKLLPTTVLHHQHTGEIMISVLLLQDLIAILVMLFLHGSAVGGYDLRDLFTMILGLPLLILFAFLFSRYILIRVIARFDKMREYMFMVAIAWCLSLATLANLVGLSYEIGAFIAGVTIAASPISLYIAESLKPLRDFFLVLFFFSIGASFNAHYFHLVAIPALVLGGIMLITKPLLFQVLLRPVCETKQVAREVGVRLGQVSEFSLLIAYVASSGALISEQASFLIQATTMFTFVVSTYWVVMKYPTPMALSEKLRRD